MFQYLPFVLSIATCRGFSSVEIFDVFGTDQETIDGVENDINRNLRHMLDPKKLNGTATTERSKQTAIDDIAPWNFLVEIDNIKTNSATNSSIKTIIDESLGQDPLDAMMDLETVSTRVAENSIKTSDETLNKNPWNLEIEGLTANNASTEKSMEPSGEIATQVLWNSPLEAGRVVKSVATTGRSMKTTSDETVNMDPWSAFLEIKKLHENNTTTERSLNTSSNETATLDPWSAFLEVERLHANSVTTENSITTSSDETSNQDVWNTLIKEKKLSKSVATTESSMIVSNMDVKENLRDTSLEVISLNKNVATTEDSMTSSELGTRVKTGIDSLENIFIASQLETTTEEFLRITVGYRRAKPSSTATDFPLSSSVELLDCPEEEQPLNLGAYEVPTQRDLVFHARRVLLASYRAYHRKALRILRHMKEATKASWPRVNSCHAASKLMYRRCVRRVSKRCELTGKSLVLALESLKEDVMDLIQGKICNISAMNVDPIQLIRILAMERVSLEFALPGFLRLLNACGVYCMSGPINYSNITRKRLRKMSDQQLVISHFLTKKSYKQLLKGAT